MFLGSNVHVGRLALLSQGVGVSIPAELVAGYVADWDAESASRHGEATLNGNASTDSGLILDGVGDWAYWSSATDMGAGTDDFSITFEIDAPASLAATQCIISKYTTSGSGNGIGINIASSTGYVFFEATLSGSGSRSYRFGGTDIRGSTVKVGCYRESGELKIYIDDVEEVYSSELNPTTVRDVSNSEPFRIGYDDATGGYMGTYLDATIRDVIFNVDGTNVLDATFALDQYDRATPDDGGWVGAVIDTSENLNHANQATPDNRGEYNAADLNSLATITFDGVHDLYTSTLDVTQGFTIHSVVNCTSSAAIKNIVSDASYYLGLDASDYASMNMGSAVAASTDLSGAWHVITYIVNGASSSIRVDGSEVATGNPGANGLTNISLGKLLNGDMAKTVVYDSALSGGDAAANEIYLATMYAI